MLLIYKRTTVQFYLLVAEFGPPLCGSSAVQGIQVYKFRQHNTSTIPMYKFILIGLNLLKCLNYFHSRKIHNFDPLRQSYFELPLCSISRIYAIPIYQFLQQNTFFISMYNCIIIGLAAYKRLNYVHSRESPIIATGVVHFGLALCGISGNYVFMVCVFLQQTT